MGALLPSGRIDSLGMHDATMALPEQIESAAAVARDVAGLPDFETIENVLVVGMGGSGIAGEVLRAAAGPLCPLPIVVAHSYSIPSFVSSSTLCVAVSFSGNTEETVEAAQEAFEVGASMVIVASGGELATLASEWEVPFVGVDPTIPQPRAAIGALAVPAIVLLERLGAYRGASEYLTDAVAQLRRRRDQLTADDNPAARLARRIGRTMPLIYGGHDLGGVAAARWKTQVNENAKAPAFASQIPELTHNEVCGFGAHGDVTRQVFTLVTLRHDFEHPQVSRRFDLVEQVVDEVVASRQEVRAEGDGPLSQLFDLIFFGDVMSLHLAHELEIDPGPVDVLSWMKHELAVE